MDSVIADYLGQTPAALERLGADIFLAVPLYRSARTCTPVYINTDAYMRIFKPAAPPSWAEMSATLSALFSTTIEPEHGTGEVVATAYVDRQSDPLDLSLSGNLGSGRAYYAGACFNIKGERTPLATAPKKQFSDGFLEMERAIWETLVAAGLQGSISNGLNDVLAIIDMNDTCTVGWRDAPVTRAKVIRLDDGCLDRVTHLFHVPRPLPAAALHATAAAFGRLEADKFTGRLAHGTWSPGNISMQGHLIDFDTVGAIKGRGPLYSSTRWYHQNRFGFEHGGQATILTALAGHAVINRDGVSAQDLHDTLRDSLDRQTLLNFITLMGFDDAQVVAEAHGDKLVPLCRLWQELARKVYYCPDAFMLKDLRAHHVHVFDLSLMMAAYPLLKRAGYTHGDLLAVMGDDALADDLMNTEKPPALGEIEQQHMDAVEAVIGVHYVRNNDQRDMLCLAALGFVKKYDATMRDILADGTHDPLQVEAAALARNADRAVLFPALTPTFRLAENGAARTPVHRHAIIASLVAATRRPMRHGTALAVPLGIYDEGAVSLVLDGAGSYRLAFTSHHDTPPPAALFWRGDRYILDNNGFSEKHALLALATYVSREASLQAPEISIYSQIEHMTEDLFLTPL